MDFLVANTKRVSRRGPGDVLVWNGYARHVLILILAGAILIALSALCSTRVWAQQVQDGQGNGIGLTPHYESGEAPRKLRYPWASIASGKNEAFGWSYEARSEQEADELAVEACERAGGIGCTARVSVQGRCGILAKGEKRWAMAVSFERESRRRVARRSALRRCGPDCRIIKEVCSIR